jgi:hypothetical protein
MVTLPALRLGEDHKGRSVCMSKPSPMSSTSASDPAALEVIGDLAAIFVTFV